MSNQTAQYSWLDLKAEIAARWSRFNDTQLESFRNNLDQVSVQVQETYGIAKEQAEKEYADFSSSLRSVKDTAKANFAPVIRSIKNRS